MSKTRPARHRSTRLTRRGLWTLVALAATLAAVVAVAFATGLLSTSAAPQAGSDPEPTTSSSPESTPTAVPPTEGAAAQRFRPAIPMTRSVPTRVLIPSIDVDSSLMSLGLKADGSLETPPGAFPAGWFTGAPTPGQLGPAIIVGHVRYNTPGVFARLSQMHHGDRIDVERADGSTAKFQVTRVAHFAKSTFPTQRVYGNIDHAGLRLITCGGLDAATAEFEENVVVFADLTS